MYSVYPYPLVIQPTCAPPFVPAVQPPPSAQMPSNLRATLGNEHSPLCRHFAEGRCERGATCKFSHDLSKGIPTERHRLIDVVRIMSVYEFDVLLSGKDAVNETLRVECADRFIARVISAPCCPHPKSVNHRIKMYELHIQERRGYSVRNPRPRKSLDEVLAAWDAILTEFSLENVPLSLSALFTNQGYENEWIIGRCPSYGYMRLPLQVWAHATTIYFCECLVDLLRRELVKQQFFHPAGPMVDKNTISMKYGIFRRSIDTVLAEHMLTSRYKISEKCRVAHHPETFLDVLRLTFPQLIVSRVFPTNPTSSDAYVRLLVAGKTAQIESFFDRVAEYVYIVAKSSIQPHIHNATDETIENNVIQHWRPDIGSLDDAPPAVQEIIHHTWNSIIESQFISFSASLGNERSIASEPVDQFLDAEYLAQHYQPAETQQWEEWHVADARRALHNNEMEDGKPKFCLSDESEALERRREKDLLELLCDSD